MTSTIRRILARDMASTYRPEAEGLIRLDRCLANVERHVEEQEAHIRQEALFGVNTAADEFDLQKTRLLLAILRESRARITQKPGYARVSCLHSRG